LELQRFVGAAAGRTRAPRQQFVGNAPELRDQLVDRMRALLDQALVRAARTKLADVDRLVFRDASIRNLHVHGWRAPTRRAAGPTACRCRANLQRSWGTVMTSRHTANRPSRRRRGPQAPRG